MTAATTYRALSCVLQHAHMPSGPDPGRARVRSFASVHSDRSATIDVCSPVNE